jgi:hypothetical protein
VLVGEKRRNSGYNPHPSTAAVPFSNLGEKEERFSGGRGGR